MTAAAKQRRDSNPPSPRWPWAGETGKSAESILTAANDLSSQSDVLKSAVEEFLGKVRAA